MTDMTAPPSCQPGRAQADRKAFVLLWPPAGAGVAICSRALLIALNCVQHSLARRSQLLHLRHSQLPAQGLGGGWTEGGQHTSG